MNLPFPDSFLVFFVCHSLLSSWEEFCFLYLLDNLHQTFFYSVKVFLETVECGCLSLFIFHIK